jgi:hypothetical protein
MQAVVKPAPRRRPQTDTARTDDDHVKHMSMNLYAGVELTLSLDPLGSAAGDSWG